ncbi:MAG TPA: hypothetical protein VF669_14795 [Tepidisphaeraceae bacterium]|jgi:hypothetical protein
MFSVGTRPANHNNSFTSLFHTRHFLCDTASLKALSRAVDTCAARVVKTENLP